MSCCCCVYKNRKIQRKQALLESSNNLSDYYMDVNIYIKNMLEMDLIKKILFNKDKNLSLLLENFRPILKDDYTYKYINKLSSLYKNNISDREIEGYVESIKRHSSNIDFLKELSCFYDIS